MFKRLWDKPFIRSVGLIAGGTAAGQLIAVAAIPFITRLYTPRDFGILAVFVSVLSMINVISSLRYETAIPIADNQDMAFNLMADAALTLFLSCVMTGVGVYVFRILTLGNAGMTATSDCLWLLPIGLAVSGLNDILTGWAVRAKRYTIIARTKVTQNVGMIATQLGVGFAELGPWGLCLGFIVGNSGGNTSLGYAFRLESKGFSKAISPRRMLDAAKRFRTFPLIAAPAALVNTAGLNLPALLMAAYYGPQAAGWFALVQRVFASPTTLIGKAVSQVFMGEGPTLLKEDPLAFHRLFRRTAAWLLLLAGVPSLVLCIWGQTLFSLIFGAQWMPSGTYAQLMSLMFLTKFAMSPLAQTLVILERQSYQLYSDVGRLIGVVASFWGGKILGWSAPVAIGVYSASMGLSYVLLYFVSDAAIRGACRRSIEVTALAGHPGGASSTAKGCAHG